MNTEGIKPVLLMAVAVVAIGGGLVYWQFSNRSSAEQRVMSLEAQIPDEEELKADLEKSQMELAEFRTQLAHLEKGVPNVAYVPTLLKELEEVGAENEITVTGVRPVPVGSDSGQEPNEAYQELEIDITGQGTYRAVMNLIASLQDFPKVLAVRTIGLAPQQNLGAGEGDLDATVRLKAFVFKETMPGLEGDEVALLEGSGL